MFVDAVMWLLENDRIHQHIVDMYAEFVQAVDPKGHIIDFLIQKRVVNFETAAQLRRKKTSHDRCRSLLAYMNWAAMEIQEHLSNCTEL